MRKCLSCDLMFPSVGPHNRICEFCDGENALLSKLEARSVLPVPSERFECKSNKEIYQKHIPMEIA